MFRLVRFFLATGAIVAAAIVLAFYLYRQSEVERLIELAEHQNVELARSFANTIWPRFSFLLMPSSGPDEDDPLTDPRIRELTEAVKTVTAGLPVLKVKIYTLDGRTAYSSNLVEIGEYKTSNPGFFSAAQEGRPASKLTFRDTFSSFEGTVQERDLVESYIPIRRSDGPVEGVFELYTDVTSLMADIESSTTNLLIGFLPVFGLLYGMLFIAVRRADRTIKRQYADITEKNAALQREISVREQAEAALTKARDQLEQRVADRTQELIEEIAERRRAEDESRRHRDELAHFGRVSMIGEMATGLAHELNQPLTVISGCAQLCIEKLRTDNGSREQLLDAVEQTAEQADRANKIIRRVRSFIHKEEPERKAVDVNGVIHGVMDLLQSDAHTHATEIELQLAESVPSVSADPIQVQQVIINLAHNGMEAMSDGDVASRRLGIHTSVLGDGMIEIAVRDRGPGIPVDQMDHLFDPFFTTKPQGLGMGLSISRTIVEAHGGRLWVTSDPGNDTIFHFTLPAAKDGSVSGT